MILDEQLSKQFTAHIKHTSESIQDKYCVWCVYAALWKDDKKFLRKIKRPTAIVAPIMQILEGQR